MKQPTVLVVTYSEIALKGKNRPMFQRRLLNNMRRALKGEPVENINHVESRYLVWLEDAERADACAEKLERVFGIRWISPAVAVPRQEDGGEMDEVAVQAVTMAMRDVGMARTFKVETRRSDRNYPLDSPQISRIIGTAVGAAIELPARMQRPDFTVHVLVLRQRILVFTGKHEGAGGLPAGSSGRICCLLSGGIDSPVAAWMLMSRGIRPTLVHFFAGRSVEEADADKIVELTRILALWSPTPLTLYLVPVVPYEMRAMEHVSDKYDMVMFRRFMFKTAHVVARRENCLAIACGDSLGQVASQTLHNLAAIGPDLELPVLRPLIGLNKEEITARSERIGAFEVSILPYRDCCSIRSPRPVLDARPDTLAEMSIAMDLPAAVAEALDGAAKLVVGPEGEIRRRSLSPPASLTD